MKATAGFDQDATQDFTQESEPNKEFPILNPQLLQQALALLGRSSVKGWEEISMMVSISQHFSDYIEKIQIMQK